MTYLQSRPWRALGPGMVQFVKKQWVGVGEGVEGREKPSIIRLGGLGSVISSPSGVWAEPQPQSHFGIILASGDNQNGEIVH